MLANQLKQTFLQTIGLILHDSNLGTSFDHNKLSMGMGTLIYAIGVYRFPRTDVGCLKEVFIRTSEANKLAAVSLGAFSLGKYANRHEIFIEPRSPFSAD